MEDIIETKGYFWFPSDPEDRLPGTLKFSQDKGIDLEIFGQFKAFLETGTKDSNIILGITSNGKPLTLLKCFEYSKSMGLPGLLHSSISAIYLFWGEHFISKEEINFDSMSIVYEDINYWLDISGFERPINNSEKKEVILKYKKPEDLIYNINMDWQIGIEFVYFSQLEYFIPLETASIRQVPELFIRPAQKENFEAFYKHFHIINSFLTVCYFTFPKIKSIEFKIKNLQRQNELDIEINEVKLYFQHSINYEKYSRHDSKHRFLLTYQDLKLSFQSVISNWFELNDKIGATINILTNCFMNRKESTEFYFLGLAQAMENMHRRLTGKKATFLQRIKMIISNLPENIREGLLSNESNFSERIRDNRNYFTHYDEKLEKGKASLNELFLLSEKMKIIIIVNLIKELGFSDAQVENFILGKSVWLFNHLIKRKT